MIVKLDEDLSPLVAEAFEAAGCETRTVAGQGWSGLSDAELWKNLQAETIFFVTADKGFGDVRQHPPGSHAGILLLRPDRESIMDFRALVSDVVAGQKIESLKGAVSVATPRGLRSRRARRS